MMDAVEFLKEKDRMCRAICIVGGFVGRGDKCEIERQRERGQTCGGYMINHPEEAVEIVERWAKEHPRKTRQSEFLEQFSKMFPRMNQDNFWWKDICPKDIDTKVKCPVCANGMTMHCTDCREIYWLEEVEE